MLLTFVGYSPVNVGLATAIPMLCKIICIQFNFVIYAQKITDAVQLRP